MNLCRTAMKLEEASSLTMADHGHGRWKVEAKRRGGRVSLENWTENNDNGCTRGMHQSIHGLILWRNGGSIHLELWSCWQKVCTAHPRPGSRGGAQPPAPLDSQASPTHNNQMLHWRECLQLEFAKGGRKLIDVDHRRRRDLDGDGA